MSKLIDQNGRVFGKISVIDLLVVLVVVMMAAALYTKNNKLDVTATNQTDTPIIFTMVAENQPFQVADAVQVGDMVYDKDRSSGGALGEIIDVQTLPASKIEQMRNGTFARLTNEDANNLLITVKGSGSVVDGRYSLNRVYELGANAARSFYTAYAAFTATVTEIHS